MSYNYHNYHYFSQLSQHPRCSYPGFQAHGPCLTITGIEDDVLVMPHSPLGDYDPEPIDPEVEEVPAKDALISVSVKITGCNQKRSEQNIMLRDIDVNKINNIRSLKARNS